MIKTCDRLQREIAYNPAAFRGMLAEHGGVEPASRLMTHPAAQSGLERLWQHSRLGESVEAHILLPRFAPSYRCRLTGGDYAAPPDGHPRSLAIREDRILPVLDEWLVDLFAPDRITEVAAQIVDADRLNRREHHEVQGARQAIAEARRKIERYMDGIEAGMDPGLVAERPRSAQADIAIAQAVLDSAHDMPVALTIAEVMEVLDAVRALPALLGEADIELRAEVYRSLGLQLWYRREDEAEYVRVLASLTGVDLVRVGGGT